MERIRITGSGSELQGVGRLPDGRAVFVPGALPGELVTVEPVRQSERWCEARLLSIEEPSEQRSESACPYYGQCGGCRARHMDYACSLTLKRQRVLDALTRIGRLEQPNVLPTIGREPSERTRNKAEYAISNGRIGVLEGDTHRVVEVDDCLLQSPISIRAMRWLRDRLPSLKGAERLRYLVTRVNRRGELMLTLSGEGIAESLLSALTPQLRRALPELVSYSMVRLRPRHTHALDGRLTQLWGRSSITETLLGLEFSIAPQAFLQVDPQQAELLYTKALEAAGLSEPCSARVLDAYCGAGTITLAAARNAAYAVGVELVSPAIENARLNAQANGLQKKTRFICGDAPEEILRLLAQGERFDSVILDPPRKGAEARLMQVLAQKGPQRIAYVSCDPGTLARDVRILSEGGYRLEWAQPVDMFPWTAHVETVACLTR